MSVEIVPRPEIFEHGIQQILAGKVQCVCSAALFHTLRSLTDLIGDVLCDLLEQFYMVTCLLCVGRSVSLRECFQHITAVM